MDEFNNQEKIQVISPIQMQMKVSEKYEEMIKNFSPFGISCLAYGVLFTICLYRGFQGVSMPVLTLATIGLLFFLMKKLGSDYKKTDFFYVVGIQLLGLSSCLTGDLVLVFFNTCGIWLLIVGWLLSRFCNTEKWSFTKYLKELINTTFVPIAYMNGFFKALGNYFSNKDSDTKNAKTKYIWLGALIGIPFVMIVTALLVSADAVFGNLFRDIFNNIAWPENPIWMLLLAVAGVLGSFAVLAYFADDRVDSRVEDKRNWEPVIAITFLSFSTVVYLIFSVIQILYLFIGGLTLPKGYTYATYAHEGFYQLLVVCLMNLIVLFICIGRFRDHLVLKIVLTIFSGCTYIMLASSALRMILYIDAYKLTYLRVLTLWGLFVIALTLAGCMTTIWKNEFPLFQYTMIVVTVLYIAFSLARPGYFIAKYNLEKGTNVDVDYILYLNSDAVEAYLKSDYLKKELPGIMEEYDTYSNIVGDNYDVYKYDQDGNYVAMPRLYQRWKDYQRWDENVKLTNFNFANHRVSKLFEEKLNIQK